MMIVKNKKLNDTLFYFGETYSMQVDLMKTFDWQANKKIHCTFRTYDNIIEYNPLFIKELSEEDIYDDLLVLSTRILFGHPYRDIPEGISPYHVAELSDWEIIEKLNLPVKFDDRDFYESLGHGDDYIWMLYRSEFMNGKLPACPIKQSIIDRALKKLTVNSYHDQAEFWHENQEQYNKVLNFVKERSDQHAIMERNCKEIVRESFRGNPSCVGPWERCYN